MIILQSGSAVLAERVEESYGWVNTAGGTSTDRGKSISTDQLGNIYTAGYFQGTVDFDPSAGVDNHTSAGDNDVFLTKINADGSYGYTKVVGGGASDLVWDVSTYQGDVYLVGEYSSTVDFDPSAGVDNHTSVGSSDIFLTKINADGSYGYTKSIGGVGVDSGRSVKLDQNGNVHLAGVFSSTVDFDPSAGVDNHTSAGDWDVFLTKINADGSYGYTSTFGGTGIDIATTINMDIDENIYIGGSFLGTADFDPSAGVDNHTSSSFDIFLTKINANGSYGYTKTMTGNDSDASALSVVADSLKNVYITGYYQGEVDFDPGAGSDVHIPSGDYYSDYDIYLTKINADGSYGYTKVIGDVGFDQAYDMTIDAYDNIYLTGSFEGTVDFDPSTGVDNKSSVASSSDIFLTKINADGSYGYTNAVGGASGDVGQGVAVDMIGNVFITGLFRSSVDFDPTSGSDVRTSTGSDDIFITKLRQQSYYQHIDNLGGGLSAITLVDSASVDDEGVDPGVPKGNTEATRLLKTTLPLADAEVDYSTDRDWSSVIGDTDIAEGKAFVHNLRSAEGVVSDYTLYVPKLSGYSQVGFCPGATSFAELTTGCVGFAAKTEADPDVSVVNVDGQDYWAISGVSGSGGFHFNNSSTNNGQQTGAESDADGLAASGQNQVLIMILALSTILLAMGGVFWANRHKLCN